MTVKILLLVIMAIIPTSTLASLYTGDILLKLASHMSKEANIMFRGYVAGVQDSVNDRKNICIPENLELNSSSNVVKLYLERNSSKLNQPANFLVFEALKESFPCNKL